MDHFAETIVDFIADDAPEVHTEGAIELICAPFRSHEDGLPEWVKNASDMYRRREVPTEDSVILVLFKNGSKVAGEPSLVGCLDFGGMSGEDIEGKFRRWADPDASGNAVGVQGGHGNGGKCYMTQMFEEYSYAHTLKDGRASRYGFQSGSLTPGYFGRRDVTVEEPDAELNEALADFGLTISDLPKAARMAWESSSGFTLLKGVSAKDARNRLPAKKWADSLRGHPQMVQVLQLSRVYVYANRQAVSGAAPLELPKIETLPDADDPRRIEIPETLTDPSTGDEVAMRGPEDEGAFEIRTSKTSMVRKKTRHTVNGWTLSGRSTGYWRVDELTRASYAKHFYGDVYLDALSRFKQNDRHHHAEAPLTRALRSWLEKCLEDYSSEFVRLEQLQASKEERDALSKMNEALNQWKDGFLEREFGGIGKGSTRGRGTNTREPLPEGVPATVILELKHTQAGVGVTLQPAIRFYDADGKRIASVPRDVIVSDSTIASFDRALGTLTTLSPGQVTVHVDCPHYRIQSNSVTLTVLHTALIETEPTELEVRAGGYGQIRAQVLTTEDELVEGAYVNWTIADETIASVSPSGRVYGIKQGQTHVTAFVSGGDDARIEAPSIGVVVVEGETEEEGGSGFPLILLSEIDKDPLGEGSPTFSREEPPVHQRPQDFDNNIWWINVASPLARRFLDKDSGGGNDTQPWRSYLLERYIEVMVKIVLTYDHEQGEELTFEQMVRRWDEQATEMQKHMADSLGAFLSDGTLPLASGTAE